MQQRTWAQARSKLVSYAGFLHTYNATDRAKGDGYDPAMFADMSADERRRSTGMLLERGLAGDAANLHGLEYVGGAGAIAALRAG